MNVIDFHFVGPPCGRHGPYTFYRAFAFKKSGKYKILTLGEFFFLKISSRELCVGELQLLWEDKNNQLSLSSSRLYFLPGDSLADVNTDAGEDEVLAMSEKAVLRLEDLAAWTAPTLSPEPSSTSSPSSGSLNAANGHSHSPNMVNGKENSHPENGEIEQLKTSVSTISSEDCSRSVTVLSYPRYCRYRAVLKRLENASPPVSQICPSSVLDALGTARNVGRSQRVLFCRDTVDRPDLERHPSFCNHLSPNLKGRPRKKVSKGWRGRSPSSESNASEDAKDMKEALRKKLTKIKIQNFKNGTKQRTAKEILEEEEFLAKLFQFMRDRNSPIERVPHLGFKQINLYLFYSYAQNLGGYDKVTNKKLWKRIYDVLGGSPGSTSAATCTRRHYERLLLPYERHQKGEEHKPLPPPVKHRRSSLGLSKTPDSNAIVQKISETSKDVLNSNHSNHSHENSNGTSLSTSAPSSPLASIMPLETDLPAICTNDKGSTVEKESSSTPSSSRPHSAISTPSPCIDTKTVGQSVDGSSECDVVALCSRDSTWPADDVQHHIWKTQKEDVSTESKKREEPPKAIEKVIEILRIDKSSNSSHNSFSSSPSFSNFLKQQKSMPQLYSFPAREKNSEAVQRAFALENASGPSPPQLSVSVSPPPLLHIQMNQDSLARLVTASTSSPSSSPSSSLDHLPSPPPLVDLTRVVNALPMVQSDSKPLSEPNKNTESDPREDVSSPKRFRCEDVENIHPRIGDVLSQRKELGTTLDKVHPYSLPFLHLSQRHANEKVKMLSNYKATVGRNSERNCNGEHKNHTSTTSLVARPSVIQHTQKTPPIFERDKPDAANVHPFASHRPIAAHQQERPKMNGLVPASVGSNGSVQYCHQQYYQQSNAHSPALSQAAFANGDVQKSNTKNFSVAPKYYPAPKLFVQPQGYHGSPYVNQFCPPYESEGDQVLDLSIKKPKTEDTSKAVVSKPEPVQKSMPLPKYNIEYERITPPEKELDLSIKYEEGPAVSPLVRCASASTRAFPPRGLDNPPQPVRETENNASPIVVDVGEERCKSDTDSPIDVTSVDIKSEPMGQSVGCNHPMCTSAHCYPYKQPYFSSGSHLSSSPYYSSSFFGFHPQFLVSQSRNYSPADHMQASITTYKELFHPGLLGGHYPYSLSSPLYPHLYKDSQPYLYQPK